MKSVKQRSLYSIKQEASRTARRPYFESLENRRLLASHNPVSDGDPPIFAAGGVEGTKWEDANGNGRRDAGEPGLTGVTIYADLNGNRRIDRGEPATKSGPDSPNTRLDETGRYLLEGLPPGDYFIREVVPDGFRQTFPGTFSTEDPFASVSPAQLELSAERGQELESTVSVTVHPFCIRAFELDVVALRGDEIGVPGVEVVNHSGIQINGCGGDVSEFEISMIVQEPGPLAFEIGFRDELGGNVIARIPVSLNGPAASNGHFVSIQPNSFFSGLDFGNHPRVSTGSIEGQVWIDANGDHRQDPNERGLGGVNIYLDLNDNGRLDPREPTARTQFDEPTTDFDEGGRYLFPRVEPGTYTVLEVLPNGYEQTFPQLTAAVQGSETGRFSRGVALDLDVTDVRFQESDVDATGSTAEVEVSVVWPNGCGAILPNQTTHTVIGQTILVGVVGHQVGEICTQALQTDTVTVGIDGVAQGEYTVVGTLQERLSDGQRATLGVVSTIQIGPQRGHEVTVRAGETTGEVNFGNHRFGSSEVIRGVKWHDQNGDGRRQRNEPGLPGVTIYSDLNNNGVLDPHEPSTQSRFGLDPSEVGSYTLEGLQPGIHTVREVVPEGFRQTFPLPIPALISIPLPPPVGRPIPVDLDVPNGSHTVVLRPGQDADGFDFGNQSSQPGSVHGLKWNDLNGNGQVDPDEPGVPGVTIYVDLNQNGRHEEGEPSAQSMSDDPRTEGRDETGMYWIQDVPPGNQMIREVIPDGFHQTYPARFFPPPFFTGPGSTTFPGRPIFFGHDAHFVQVASDQAIDGVNFGNRKSIPGAIHGLKWRDDNGNGRRDSNEPGLPGVTIYLDANFNGVLDEGERRTLTMADDPATRDVNEAGQYWLEDLEPRQYYHVREVVPEGFRQTFPFNWVLNPPIPIVRPGPAPGISLPFPSGQHVVLVDIGSQVRGIDFGNRSIERIEPPIVRLGDADGNGKVDFDDFAVLAVNFGREVDAVFADGDFDQDGAVTFDDFQILSQRFES